MRRKLLVLAIFVLAGTSAFSQVLIPADSTAAAIRRHLNYLASDALMGRSTPSAGLDSAAEYIIRYFRKLNIGPAAGSYRHNIGLFRQKLGKGNAMTITLDGKSTPIPLKNGFIPFGFTADTSVDAPLVFAGYGITDTASGYDDYRGLDVKGKIVVVLSDGPKSLPPDSRLAMEASKYFQAVSHGADGFIMVSGPARRLILKPRGYPWPSLSKLIPNDLLPVEVEGQTGREIPAVHAGEPFINVLWGSADALKEIQNRLDDGKPASAFVLPGATVSLTTDLEKERLRADNVVAVIEGSDPVLKKEMVVIGAHYDHLGFGKDKGDGSDYIYNGSDDNASGTSGVLEMARLFREQPVAPKRTVVFMLFAGEERGLLGSQAYVKRPLYPLAETVAMINLDMISRNGDTLYLEGAESCPELSDIASSKNGQINLSLILNHKDLGGSSDHASFASHGVPFLFFITGLHKDYHKVTDNPDRSDAMKAAQVARLAFLTAWQVAGESRHYSLKK